MIPDRLKEGDVVEILNNPQWAGAGIIVSMSHPDAVSEIYSVKMHTGLHKNQRGGFHRRDLKLSGPDSLIKLKPTVDQRLLRWLSTK